MAKIPSVGGGPLAEKLHPVASLHSSQLDTGNWRQNHEGIPQCRLGGVAFPISDHSHFENKDGSCPGPVPRAYHHILEEGHLNADSAQNLDSSRWMESGS